MSENKLVSEFLSLVRIDDYNSVYSKDIADGRYFGMPLEPIVSCEKRLISKNEPV